MKNKFVKIIIVSILFLTNMQGQVNNISIGNCDEIVRDSFGNFYTLNISAGFLEKYSQNYELLCQFNVNSGNQSVFVSPKNINIVEPDIIYILDDQELKIVEFDEYLNFIQEIDLPKDFIYPSEFIVLSNRDWLIYDEFQKEIFRIKPGENISQSWGDEKVKHFLNERVKLKYMNGMIYMFMKKNNKLLVINDAGMVKIEIKMNNNFNMKKLLNVDSNNVIFTDNEKVFSWNLRENTIDTLSNYSDIIFFTKKNKNIMIDNRGKIINFLQEEKAK